MFPSIDYFGGGGWIRTSEAKKQQIYSLSPLATRELPHMEWSEYFRPSLTGANLN